LAHGARPAREATLDQFTPQLRRVVAAFDPAPVQIILVRRKTAWLWRFAPKSSPSGSEPTANRLALDADQCRDALDRHARGPQLRSLLVARMPTCMGILTASFGDCWPGYIGWGKRNGRRLSRHFSSDLLGNPPNPGVMTVDDSLNGIPKIA
jgi:hypothetical protein